jgi:hypothetical protein
MSAIQPPEGLSLTDFEAIESAVSETVRGRWFLAEFARRTRAEDTGKVLAALTRLEHLMVEGRPEITPPDPHLLEALAAVCERLRDIAWTLRERGIDAGVCGALESEVQILTRLQPPGEVPLERLPAPPAAEPVPRPQGLIDRIEPLRPALPQAPADAAPTPNAEPKPTLAEIDAWPFRDKLLFFA